MGILFRWYINALLNGNPLAVAVTIVGVAAVSMGPFHDGLSRRDPGAIALATLVGTGVLVLLAVAIIDRRSNAPKRKKKRKKQLAGSGDARRPPPGIGSRRPPGQGTL